MNNEQFQDRVFSNFDKLYKKIDDLCDRTARIETKIEEKEKETNRHYKIGFAIIGVIFGAYAVIKEMFS